ncbi:MAG: hypothetical protein U2P59_03530 [Synergistota bacterium]|nr:hypothetical protein [Synergistota bacterium]
MDNFIYALFVAAALILMVWMSVWKVRKNRKYYEQFRNGRMERWRF